MTAPNLDPNLVNGWGLSRSSATPWWVSDNGTGVATLYTGAGVPVPLVVKIPPPKNSSAANGHPTGTVFNYDTTGFMLAGKASFFMFVTSDGTISGWAPGFPAAMLAIDHSGKSEFTGCTLATNEAGTFLYVADFKQGNVDIYDSSWKQIHLEGWAFRDPRVPHDFAPFNVQSVGGNIVVTYAKQQHNSPAEADGPGLGFVSIFDKRGRLLQRLEHGRFMNAPWGVTEAPSDFGVFSHRLLVGNLGDGTIHAFNLLTGRLEGTLEDATNKPISVDGLWALGFGNNGTAGSSTTLFFTSGPNEYGDGVLGTLTPAAAEQRGNNE